MLIYSIVAAWLNPYLQYLLFNAYNSVYMEKVCTNFGVVFFLKMFIVFTFNLVHVSLHKKMKFSIKDFFSKCDQIRAVASVTK